MSKSYKNIIELLKSIYPSKREDVVKSPRAHLYEYVLFPKMNHFKPIKHSDSKVRLYQYNPTGFLYRGQNKWYENITPKIYRKGIRDFKRFTYRLMLNELKIILDDHPIVQDFIKSNFHVSVMGIAQHYGIPTEWIDFTADPMVAAFFATSRGIDGKYEISKEGIGVIYKTPLLLYNQDGIENCEILGFQPFVRPYVQKAYALQYSKDVFLNWHEMKFLHNKDCSEKIFDYFKGGELLFPKDLLSEIVRRIIESNTFSKEALIMTLHKYPQYNQYCKKYLYHKEINVVDSSIHSFSEHEISLIRSQYDTKIYNLIEEPLYFHKLDK